MIGLPVSVLVLAAVGGLRVQERDEQIAELLADMRLMDEAGLTAEILDRYAGLIEDPGVLARQGEAIAILARAAFAAGEEDRAWLMIQRAVPSPRSQHFVELERARLHMEGDDLERAQKTLTEPLGNGDRTLRFPDDRMSYLLLAKIHARLEEYDLAAPAAVRFLALAPRDREAAAAWHILAQAALKTHDADHARTCLRHAEELRQWHDLLRARKLQVLRHPEDPLPRLGSALLWMEAREYGVARDELLELVRRFPAFCRGWFHLGEAERLLEEVDAALEAYGRCLECDPGYASARMNRGVAFYEAGRLAEAKADLERLVAGAAGEEATYAGAYLVLARLLVKEGKEEEAAKRYARYRELGGEERLEE